MTALMLRNMESREDLEEFVYHLKGLVEASETISLQASALDEALSQDDERAADILGRLRAEIYTHLTYHLKELRRPFLRLEKNLDKEEREGEPGSLES